MTIQLVKSISPANQIQKRFKTDVKTYSGVVFKDKSGVSIRNPSFLIREDLDKIRAYDYCFLIDNDGKRWRAYFISDILSYRNDLIEVQCKLDVLESYQEHILNSSGYINRGEKGWNPYLSDPFIDTLSYINLGTRNIGNVMNSFYYIGAFVGMLNDAPAGSESNAKGTETGAE